MQIGMVGLGKMGGNMAVRLLRGGHHVVGYDLDETLVRTITAEGLIAAASPQALAEELTPRRCIWIMVPAGEIVDRAIESLRPYLSRGDILIDGGNSNYKDSVRRHRELAAEGFAFIDVGTSGGVWGLEYGYSLMAGGDDAAVEALTPVLDTLAMEEGWGHVGPAGAGHFVKMVHNGIEYGMMQAFAEGFAVMAAKEEFDVDLHQVAEIWRRGSVVRSWLLDLTSELLSEDPDLAAIAPYVQDSGEGRWTVQEAIDLNIPAPVITAALMQRIQSRDDNSFVHRMLAGMRKQFGGHAVREA